MASVPKQLGAGVVVLLGGRAFRNSVDVRRGARDAGAELPARHASSRVALGAVPSAAVSTAKMKCSPAYS
ncbi:unnamed protein product [Lampetra fluviatilis]